MIALLTLLLACSNEVPTPEPVKAVAFDRTKLAAFSLSQQISLAALMHREPSFSV